jgi:hypothetical protein
MKLAQLRLQVKDSDKALFNSSRANRKSAFLHSWHRKYYPFNG